MLAVPGTRFAVPARDLPAQIADADISPVWEESAPLHAVPDPGLANPLFHSRDSLFRRLLAVADVLGAYVALILAVVVRGHASLRPEVVLIAPFIILACKTIGLYDRDQHTLRKTTVDELPSILYVSVLYALATWFAETLLVDGWFGRPEVLSLGLGSFVFITLGRTAARRIALAATPPERCMVLGNATDARRTVTKLTDAPGVKAELVGRVSLRPNDNTVGSGARQPRRCQPPEPPGHRERRRARDHRARRSRSGGDAPHHPHAQGARRQGERPAETAGGRRLLIDV